MEDAGPSLLDIQPPKLSQINLHRHHFEESLVTYAFVGVLILNPTVLTQHSVCNRAMSAFKATGFLPLICSLSSSHCLQECTPNKNSLESRHRKKMNSACQHQLGNCPSTQELNKMLRALQLCNQPVDLQVGFMALPLLLCIVPW